MKNVIRYLAVVFAVIPLSALLFNLFEMPAELDLSKENYQALQDFNGGLSWLVVFEIGALVMTAMLLLIEKQKKKPYRNLLIALVCFVISIVLFFTLVLPANNTLKTPPGLTYDWNAVRSQWEYTNAARAVVNFTAFSFIVLALIKNRNYYKVYD